MFCTGGGHSCPRARPDVAAVWRQNKMWAATFPDSRAAALRIPAREVRGAGKGGPGKLKCKIVARLQPRTQTVGVCACSHQWPLAGYQRAQGKVEQRVDWLHRELRFSGDRGIMKYSMGFVALPLQPQASGRGRPGSRTRVRRPWIFFVVMYPPPLPASKL